MAVIKLTRLGGLYPSVLPRNLANDAAQTIDNLLARTSEFRPLATDLAVATVNVSNPQTLHRLARKADGSFNSDMSTGWLAEANVVSYVKGPLNDDTTERGYYSFAGGAMPPRAVDVTGVSRRMGVPAPSTPPTALLSARYTFSEDVKRTEVSKAVQEAIELARTVGATPVLIGLGGAGDAFAATGWLRESEFNSALDARKNVIRIFALNPATNAVIATYSTLPVTESAWLFDPALGGFYATKPAGFTLPAWAAGHTKWWCIRLRGYAQAYEVLEAPLSRALQTLDMPGTQGAKTWLSAAEADTVALRLAQRFDPDLPLVESLVNTLRARQTAASNLFDRGGAAAMGQAVKDFYARPEIAGSIEAASTAFAETIWRYAESIGLATATPWYAESIGLATATPWYVVDTGSGD